VTKVATSKGSIEVSKDSLKLNFCGSLSAYMYMKKRDRGRYRRIYDLLVDMDVVDKIGASKRGRK
jgi:hypothetical protein